MVVMMRLKLVLLPLIVHFIITVVIWFFITLILILSCSSSPLLSHAHRPSYIHDLTREYFANHLLALFCPAFGEVFPAIVGSFDEVLRIHVP
jgi:hypothetical protein